MSIENIETLNDIIDNINIGVTVLDEHNHVVFWNQFMAKHSGINAADLIGKNLFDVFTYLPKPWMELKLKSVRLIKNYSFVSWTQKPFLFRFGHSSMMKGESIEFMHQDCTFIPIKNISTGETYVCITIHDMTDVVISQMKLTEINDINKTLEQMTNHDNLTSLYNRLYVEKQIDFEFNKAKRYGNVFSVIFFDIDKFKIINDTHGHLAGDQVLINVADTIKRQLRTSDIIGRYGGEEFFILLPETNLESASTLSQRLRMAIEKMSTNYQGFDIKITISLGVVQFRPDIKNYLQMIHEADIALYHSKQNGRNAVTRYKITGCELMNCPIPKPE
ncbi:sensor domain-containing diguanylate cyclase [Desulfamplus magnetovallimortis]|nr:sensor domain-containing diguanylate cyclase [Desulfamplus magnetovallimortis]